MIAITSINGFPLPMKMRMEAIRSAGFDSVLMWWGPDEKETRKERALAARDCGLAIENAHATTDNLNLLWCDGEEGERTFSELSAEIRDCVDAEISTLVLHLTNGSAPPEVGTVGMNRMERLIRIAEQENIRLAFENMRVPQHIDAVLSAFPSPVVGFCYDTGHENYWSRERDWLQMYGQRLFAVHLHDNMGDRDAHLVPFDGCIDWNRKMRQLAAIGYSGALAIESELHVNERYQHLDFGGFLAKALNAGKHLEQIFHEKTDL